jgi:hypothetical protein
MLFAGSAAGTLAPDMVAEAEGPAAPLPWQVAAGGDKESKKNIIQKAARNDCRAVESKSEKTTASAGNFTAAVLLILGVLALLLALLAARSTQA